MGVILGSVGHKGKIHKITPSTGKERGDLEIKDYVVLQKPQEQDDTLPNPRFHYDSSTLWKITRASYWTTDKHKTVGW